MTLPPTVRSLILSLGYCCPALFFRLFPRTSEVALRLGCTSRAVRKEKARTAAGCEGCKRCLKHHPAVVKRLEKLP